LESIVTRRGRGNADEDDLH
jgi:hypothetical protein